MSKQWKIHIGGFRKTTLIDYPGKIAAIVYTAGCNFRCPWCHNPSLIDPTCFTEKLDPDEILLFLKSRKGQLDGVVITGGEPTLWNDLELFIRSVRNTGMLVKLDTNGSRPNIIEHFMNQGIIDYIAMDVKVPLERYQSLTKSRVNTKAIYDSIELIKSSGIDYEFRTTVVPALYTEQDYAGIRELVSGAKRYVLQGFRPGNCLDKLFNEYAPMEKEALQRVADYFSGHVEELLVRA